MTASVPSILVTCAIAFTACAAQADETAFRESREIKAPERREDELIAVTLDGRVFDRTRDTLNDVRIHDSRGAAVPYLVRKAAMTKPRKVRTTWTGRDPSARPLDDGGLEITVRLDRDDP